VGPATVVMGLLAILVVRVQQVIQALRQVQLVTLSPEAQGETAAVLELGAVEVTQGLLEITDYAETQLITGPRLLEPAVAGGLREAAVEGMVAALLTVALFTLLVVVGVVARALPIVDPPEGTAPLTRLPGVIQAVMLEQPGILEAVVGEKARRVAHLAPRRFRLADKVL
jgi:hypothetical protein